MTLLLLLLLSLFWTKVEDCSLTGAQLVFLQILLIQGTDGLLVFAVMLPDTAQGLALSYNTGKYQHK